MKSFDVWLRLTAHAESEQVLTKALDALDIGEIENGSQSDQGVTFDLTNADYRLDLTNADDRVGNAGDRNRHQQPADVSPIGSLTSESVNSGEPRPPLHPKVETIILGEHGQIAILDQAIWPSPAAVIQLGNPNRDVVVKDVHMLLDGARASIVIEVIDVVDQAVQRVVSG